MYRDESRIWNTLFEKHYMLYRAVGPQELDGFIYIPIKVTKPIACKSRARCDLKCRITGELWGGVLGVTNPSKPEKLHKILGYCHWRLPGMKANWKPYKQDSIEKYKIHYEKLNIDIYALVMHVKTAKSVGFQLVPPQMLDVLPVALEESAPYTYNDLPVSLI